MEDTERAMRKVMLKLECPTCYSKDVKREGPAGPTASGSGKVLNFLRYHCTCGKCATHFLYQTSSGQQS